MVLDTPKKRAKSLVQYLEEKCTLHPDIPENLKPASLETKIEEIIVVSELEKSNLEKIK